MKILADLHISPKTVLFLRNIGHDAVRVNEIMSPTSTDKEIVETAINSNRVILTQDLDFSEIIALSGKSQPSLISLRLSSSRIEYAGRKGTRKGEKRWREKGRKEGEKGRRKGEGGKEKHREKVSGLDS